MREISGIQIGKEEHCEIFSELSINFIQKALLIINFRLEDLYRHTNE